MFVDYDFQLLEAGPFSFCTVNICFLKIAIHGSYIISEHGYNFCSQPEIQEYSSPWSILGLFFFVSFLLLPTSIVVALRNVCNFSNISTSIQYSVLGKEVHGSFSLGQQLVKKHRVMKISIFRPLICIGIVGKSTNYSTGT